MRDMSVDDLLRPALDAVACAVLTISDTRTEATDTSGLAIRTLLAGAGHTVVDYRLVRDEPADISVIVAGWAARGDIRLIITTGGTGIASRDASVEALSNLFSTELPGFGELFRRLSYDDIGAAAMLSRATAGIVHTSAVFVLPGSEQAVRLAMTRLILPQATHLARELAK
jgi:molybdenum cofactor biosynthesis protein B